MSFSYNIHGLVSIDSFESRLIPRYFLNTNNPKPDLIISRLGKSCDSIRKTSRQIGSGLFYNEEQKLVLSDAKFFGFKPSWSLKNLWGTGTCVAFNRTYPALSKTFLSVPVSTVFPIHAYIQHILHIKLLLKEYTFLVGGCFQMSEPNLGIVVSSMGEMGKTTTVLSALKSKSNIFLGDDMVIIGDDGTIYSYPKPIRRRTFFGPFCRETFSPPDEILGSRSRIGEKTKVSLMCLLERGLQNEATPITSDEASRKLLVIVRKLLPYYLERTILAYAYTDNSVNLYDIMEEERRIITSFLEKANCFVLRCNKASDYLKLVSRIANMY